MDGHMMRPSAHRLTQKRACDQRGGGQGLLELGSEWRNRRLLTGSPKAIPPNGTPASRANSPYLMAAHEL
jgi:hypothetical protein